MWVKDSGFTRWQKRAILGELILLEGVGFQYIMDFFNKKAGWDILLLPESRFKRAKK